MNLNPRLAAILLAAFALASPAFAERKLVKVEVFPQDVTLPHAGARQSLVVQATYDDGVTRDVSTEAKYTFANAALVTMKARSRAHGVESR